MDRTITTLAIVWALASTGCVSGAVLVTSPASILEDLVACCEPGGTAYSPVEDSWGDAAAEYRAAMIVDSDAGTADAIEGVDPLTGEIIIDTYTAQERDKDEEAVRLFMVE